MIRHLTLVAALHAMCIAVWARPQAGEVAVRQIVLASQQEANALRAALQGGASFEAAASERSRDDTSRRGGYVGRLRLAELRSEVRAALEALSPGEISNAIRVGNTYVLFQIVPEAESRWIDLDEAGAQALANGRDGEAATYFEQALAHAETAALGDIRIARSLDSLAAVYHLQGRAAEAEALYRRALTVLERMRAPELEMAQVLNGLGMALVKQGRFNEAAPLYSRVRTIRESRLGPDDPEVAATLQNIAALFAGEGRFAEAAKVYAQSQASLERTLGPGHPATRAAAENALAFRRSLMAELLERFSKAISLAEFRDEQYTQTIGEIRDLLPLAPLSEYSFVQMKNILGEAGLSSESEAVLRAGLTVFPASRLLHIYLADVLAETGRTQIALGVLQETDRLPRAAGVNTVQDRAEQAIVQQRIGDMQLALADSDAAVAAYQRSLELDPDATAGRVKLGKAYFSNTRLNEALAEFERAVAQKPNDVEAYLSLAEVHLASGRWEQAAASAERAIKLGASDSRALYLLGTAWIRLGRREEGQERLQEFARVEAGFAAAKARERAITSISAAAIESLRAANNGAAIETLTEGITHYPDASRLHMNLAMVQIRSDRHQAAVDTMESMLERGIGRPFLIHKNLADEYAILGNAEASRRHRRIYLESREAELIVDTGR